AGSGIAEGDLLVIEPVPGADLQDGDIVVARMQGGLDYAQVHRDGDRLFHHPLPGDGAPMAVEDPASLGQVGRLSGFYRRMSPLPDAGSSATAH
ncbi:MAG: hypothetical protein HKN73_00840, partial [Gemmatimonadetes bacterium]|nr:hypothetical protein [Gemmatimonadota bacterium]